MVPHSKRSSFVLLDELFLEDLFTRVGNTMVTYFDQNKTYVEAKRHCRSYNSKLLEIWNEEEWNEVIKHGVDSNPFY